MPGAETGRDHLKYQAVALRFPTSTQHGCWAVDLLDEENGERFRGPLFEGPQGGAKAVDYANWSNEQHAVTIGA